MRTSRRQALLGVLSAGLLPAQTAETRNDAILKADYEQNVKDARDLTALAHSIELDFDKNDQNVLSLSLLRKLDDMDKLTKRIRSRIRR